MVADIRLARSLGFNMLRKHIKVEPDRCGGLPGVSAHHVLGRRSTGAGEGQERGADGGWAIAPADCKRWCLQFQKPKLHHIVRQSIHLQVFNISAHHSKPSAESGGASQ